MPFRTTDFKSGDGGAVVPPNLTKLSVGLVAHYMGLCSRGWSIPLSL